MPQEQRAKSAIQSQFMRLYAQKGFDRITVKELCAEAPAARTTFYAHYSNLDEVKAEIEDNLLSGFSAIAQETAWSELTEPDFSVFLTKTLDYIREHWAEMNAFLIIQPNLRFIVKWKEIIRKHLDLRFPMAAHTANYELISEALAASMLGACTYWLRHPENVDTAKLNQVILRASDAMEELL